jgi:6-methylsalicylate decarboxylase
VPDASIEFMFDTVRAVMSLLYSGTLSRCPEIRFIFCHNGSAVPLLKKRICSLWNRSERYKQRIPNGPLHELKKLYNETAGSTLKESFAPLLEMVGAGNMFFGSDYPWGRMTVGETLAGLLEQGFSPADLRLIERDNALRLFPRLRSA